MKKAVHKKGGAGLIFLGVIVVVALVIFFAVWGGYNKAIRLDEQAKSSWKQVDVQLTRRFDLIPNLVETVRGYAEHESELFTHIADARTQYFQSKGAAKVRAAGQLEGFLSRLLMLQESYPNLKANESFLKLQDQLEGTENRIGVARTRYNEAVRTLNTYARGFFGRTFCGMAGVEKAEYFEMPEEKKEVPQVEF